MGHPMVPKITIAVRSNAAQGPRRVSLPSSAAAGGVPFPAVGAPALRQRSPFAGRPLDTPELLLRQPARDRAPRRERFRYAGLLPGRAAGASSSGRRPLRRCSGRRADQGRHGAGPRIRCVAGPRCTARRGSFVRGSCPRQRLSRALRTPRTLRASSRGHNRFLFSTPRRHWPGGRFRAPSLPLHPMPPCPRVDQSRPRLERRTRVVTGRPPPPGEFLVQTERVRGSAMLDMPFRE